jgi:threonine dehydrogenase-like Zn-dependent dehydrogenase
VLEELRDMTGGHGPDACVDAVGMEAHGTGVQAAYDKAKQLLRLQTDRGSALREAMIAVRKGGTLSILGVYGLMDKFPLGIQGRDHPYRPPSSGSSVAGRGKQARSSASPSGLLRRRLWMLR